MRVHINQTDSESVKSVVNKCQEDIFRCFNAFLCGNDWIDSYNNFALWETATDQCSYRIKFIIWRWDKRLQNRMTKASKCCVDDHLVFIFECSVIKVWRYTFCY
mgnify:FL=1